MVDNKYDPPLYVFTSNDYMRCLPIWVYCFNKFWGNKKVTILGYDVPNYDFPDNIEYVSLGEQVGGPKNWSTPIRDYLMNIDFDHIQWCTEDSFLFGFNEEIYYYLTNKIKNDPKIGRAALTNDPEHSSRVVNPPKKVEYGFTTVMGMNDWELIKLKKEGSFRSSGTWSIFSRSLFFELMRPNISPWEFEGETGKEGEPHNITKHYDIPDWDIIATKGKYALRTCCGIRTSRGEQINQRLHLIPINERPKSLPVNSPSNLSCDQPLVDELRTKGFIDSDNRLSNDIFSKSGPFEFEETK